MMLQSEKTKQDDEPVNDQDFRLLFAAKGR